MKIGHIFYKIFDSLRYAAIVIFFSFIIIVCFAEVFSRYVLSHSFGWTEEILRMVNVWVIMLGASIAAKRNTHIQVTFFLKYFPPTYRKKITQAVYIVLFVFFVILIVFGTKKALQNIPLEIVAIPNFSIAWFYFAIPIGSAYILLEYMLRFIYKKHPFEKSEEE